MVHGDGNVGHSIEDDENADQIDDRVYLRDRVNLQDDDLVVLLVDWDGDRGDVTVDLPDGVNEDRPGDGREDPQEVASADQTDDHAGRPDDGSVDLGIGHADPQHDVHEDLQDDDDHEDQPDDIVDPGGDTHAAPGGEEVPRDEDIDIDWVEVEDAWVAGKANAGEVDEDDVADEILGALEACRTKLTSREPSWDHRSTMSTK
ncbi:MAG: hypothetical protein M1823_005416 [Watsoniomyces obsoletus]|nr:MAG: hypothetical protein M1823_005416 [Watsoniomyces obsoletus]